MFYIDYGKQQILGDDDRAEKVYEWSLNQKAGSTFVKSLKCGLTMKVVADDTEPKLYLSWSQPKFQAFLELLGNPDSLILQHWGVDITHCEDKTTLLLVDDSDTGIPLARFEEEEEQVSSFLCMIRLGEEGPYFHTEEECALAPTSVPVEAEVEVTKTAETLQSKFQGKKTADPAVRLVQIMNESRETV